MKLFFDVMLFFFINTTGKVKDCVPTNSIVIPFSVSVKVFFFFYILVYKMWNGIITT